MYMRACPADSLLRENESSVRDLPLVKTKLKEKLNMKNNATNSPVLTLVYGAAIAAIYVC